jgi:hypothetical protein
MYFRKATTLITVLAATAGLAVLIGWGAAGESRAAPNEDWFVYFHDISVPPIERSNVTQLVDAGTIETDGFKDLVFSFGGEFKESLPQGGKIGAILIPDIDVFDYLLRNEGHFVFPLEVTFDASGLNANIFISEQQTARIAFPSYRVYLYNETSSGAKVSLFVYRTRG